MILQRVIDYFYHFIDIIVRWPGSVHNAHISFHFSLYINFTITVNGVSIPCYLIDDSAYPLNTWLIMPFTYRTGLTAQQKTFACIEYIVRGI